MRLFRYSQAAEIVSTYLCAEIAGFLEFLFFENFLLEILLFQIKFWNFSYH